MISMGHIYACDVPEVYIIDICVYIYGFVIKSSKRVSADATRLRPTASMFSTIKELNKILTVYD